MVYVLLVDGFEEIEAIEPIDIMRRAGIDVATVGVNSKAVTGSHGIAVLADIELAEVNPEEMEALVLPGGPGHELLDASDSVHNMIDNAHTRGIYIASICAAPSIIGKKGLLDGKKATCFPGFEDKLYGSIITGEKVTVDGQFITAKGAGAASDFGFALVEILRDKETSDKLRKVMQY